MGKRRPAAVVSNSVQNVALNSVVAAPLSSVSRPLETLLTRVFDS
jgi:mRNA-degrading endonuclease toxin of MazEF toxin-antitoxin module